MEVIFGKGNKTSSKEKKHCFESSWEYLSFSQKTETDRNTTNLPITHEKLYAIKSICPTSIPL